MKPDLIWDRLSCAELDKYARKPVFIVGSPRSGTTIMRYMVDGHPNIFCPHLETFIFGSMYPTFFGHIWEYQYSKSIFSRQNYVQWFRDFVLQLFANYGHKCGKSRFAEKTPSHAYHMNFIKETFPDAQFIHMIRNGYEVCNSLRRMPWASNDVEQNARVWADSVRTAKSFGSQLPSDDYIEIRLESLRDNLPGQLKRLCTFLREDFSPTMCEYFKPENNSWGVELPPFNFNKKSTPEKMTNAEGELFWRVAGDVMLELGYPSSF